MSRERKKKLELSLAALIQRATAGRASPECGENDTPSGTEVAWDRFIEDWTWGQALRHGPSERVPELTHLETSTGMLTAAGTTLEGDAGRLASTLYAVLQGLNLLMDYPPDALHDELAELTRLRDDLISCAV